MAKHKGKYFCNLQNLDYFKIFLCKAINEKSDGLSQKGGFNIIHVQNNNSFNEKLSTFQRSVMPEVVFFNFYFSKNSFPCVAPISSTHSFQSPCALCQWQKEEEHGSVPKSGGSTEPSQLSFHGVQLSTWPYPILWQPWKCNLTCVQVNKKIGFGEQWSLPHSLFPARL